MDDKNYLEMKPFLALNELAPDFTADTTHGRVKLSDYEGKWVILFSHPADFTPVCTTEFIEFSKANDDFQKMNTQLIGLSIDSVFSHIAWVRNIEEKFGVKVPFPVIADLDMRIAITYRMIHPSASNTSTVRCVFIIDPKRILRCMLYYPMTNGRNIEEIKRIIAALQTTDKHSISTPANWQPGEDVIMPAPPTQEKAEARMAQGLQCKDWYFCKRPIKEPVNV